MNVEEVVVLNSLKHSPDISKISEKYSPSNALLWKSCLDISDTSKMGHIRSAISSYEAKGGRWKLQDN